MKISILIVMGLVWIALSGGPVRAAAAPGSAEVPADIADVPSVKMQAGGKAEQTYFLIGLDEKKSAPEGGWGLLLVLPGGDGSEDFNPFIRRIYKNAVPDGFLVTQLVAVSSAKKEQIVWPTEKSPDPKQTFTTEAFIAAVIDEVSAKQKIDAKKVIALAWSSGGPAVYAAALAKETKLSRAFVAMSVFMPARLPALANAKGRTFFLLQSPDDQVTRIAFARTALRELTRAGASVELKEYEGGHGWRGDVFGNIRGGLDFLLK